MVLLLRVFWELSLDFDLEKIKCLSVQVEKLVRESKGVGT